MMDNINIEKESTDARLIYTESECDYVKDYYDFVRESIIDKVQKKSFFDRIESLRFK